MATLAEQNVGLSSPPSNAASWEPGSWTLLLIPVLVCLAMLVCGLTTDALSPASEAPAARPCVTSGPAARPADC